MGRPARAGGSVNVAWRGASLCTVAFVLVLFAQHSPLRMDQLLSTVGEFDIKRPTIVSSASASSEVNTSVSSAAHWTSAKRLLVGLRRGLQRRNSSSSSSSSTTSSVDVKSAKQVSEETRILIMGYIDRELEKMREMNRLARQNIQTLESLLNRVTHGNAAEQARAMSELRRFEQVHVYRDPASLKLRADSPTSTVAPLPRPDMLRPDETKRLHNEIQQLANVSANALTSFLFKHRPGSALVSFLHSLRTSMDSDVGEKVLVSHAHRVASVFRAKVQSAVTHMIRGDVMDVFDRAEAKVKAQLCQQQAHRHDKLCEATLQRN